MTMKKQPIPVPKKAKIPEAKLFKGSKTKKLKASYRSNMSYRLSEVPDTENKVEFGQVGVSLELPKDQTAVQAYKDTIKAGLIDIFQNSSNIIYPELTSNDIVPQPEDFVAVPFRLISATTVAGGSWRATNFGHKPQALKRAVKFLTGKTVYPDHKTDVMGWVGVVLDPQWEEERRAKNYKPVKQGRKKDTDMWNGIIPAGINGTIAIDAKTNPKLARGVLAGSIYSNSVTVLFDWEPSHTDYENEWEFLDAIGTMHEDGRMVTRNVTYVHDFFESSLVWLGADPFAKALDPEGNLVNIDHSSVVPFSKEAEEVQERYKNSRLFSANSCMDTSPLLSLRRVEEFRPSSSYANKWDKKPQRTETQQDSKEMKELFAYIATIIGLSVEQAEALSLEDFKAKVGKFMIQDGQVAVSSEDLEKYTQAFTQNKANELKIASLTADAEKFEKEAKELTAKVAEMAPVFEFAKADIEELRGEVKRLHVSTNNGERDEVMEGMFDKATPDELKAFYKQFAGKDMKRFGAECKECGSKEFTFKKSKQDEPSTGVSDLSGNNDTPSSFDEWHKRFAN